MTLVLGFGAAALLDTGPESDVATSAGNLASPLLAEAVGGGAGHRRRRDPARVHRRGGVRDHPRGGRRTHPDLGVVGGARPLRQRASRRARRPRRTRSRSPGSPPSSSAASRSSLSIPAQSLNIAFLVALAFAVAASANLPSLLYNLFWKRFNTRGATWAIYGGLITCVVLVAFSPVVSGSGDRAVHRQRLVVVPAGQPGHHLDPAGFLLRLARHHHLAASARPRRRYNELEVRSLTGAGAEEAVHH